MNLDHLPRAFLRQAPRLADPGPIGVEPAQPAAEVGVPDVVLGVDRDSERTRVSSRKRELGDRATVQPADPMGPQLREPHGPVRGDGEGGEPRIRGGDGNLLEPSADEAADLVRANLEEPDGPAAIDGDVAETTLTGGHVERCLLSIGTDAQELVRVRERGPHRPVVSDGNALASANHTAPSGAMASRPSLATGVSRLKAVIVPSDDARPIFCFDASVYHARPALSTARPSGSTLSVPFGSFWICPSRKSPMVSEDSSVNHTVPSRAAAMPTGMSVRLGSLNSWKPHELHGPTRQASGATPMTMPTAAASPSHPRHDHGRDVRSPGTWLIAANDQIDGFARPLQRRADHPR